MTDAWLGVPVATWERRWGVPLLRVYETTTSTNDVLRGLAEQGADRGTTVIADHQTRGRGRRGRTWTAPPGSSLLLSMLFRPPRGAGETLLSLRLGMAAARAIEQVVPLTIHIKWPNDIFVSHYKIGGILCEGAAAPDGLLSMVAGIGLNVSQTDEDWPEDLRDHASSLAARSGQAIGRADLAGALIAEWLDVARIDAPLLAPHEIDEFRTRDILTGTAIAVDDRPAGIARGIDPDGALRAGDPQAPVRIIAGTVRFDCHPGYP